MAAATAATAGAVVEAGSKPDAKADGKDKTQANERADASAQAKTKLICELVGPGIKERKKPSGARTAPPMTHRASRTMNSSSCPSALPRGSTHNELTKLEEVPVQGE